MAITASTAPVRPKQNNLAIKGVTALVLELEVKDTTNAVIPSPSASPTWPITIGQGFGIGVRFGADGSLEQFTLQDATITALAALAAIAAGGTPAQKALAAEAYLQSKGLAPT